jgi:hypothetical protein
MLQRYWVLQNLLAEDSAAKKEESEKFDVLLSFIDGERLDKARKEMDKAPDEANSDGGAKALADIESLPSRRVSKPPLKEDYVAKRMQEMAAKLALRGIEVTTPESPRVEGERKFTYERKVIIKNPNG